MFELINAYVEYLSNLKEIARPKMPNFAIQTYTDSEYKNAIAQIEKDFLGVDDFESTIKFLKG